MGDGLWSVGVKVAVVAATVLLVGYIGVAIVTDAPLERAGARDFWPGAGFMLIVGIGLVGVASLVDAVRDGRSRRRASAGERHDPA